jgi:hypothetical protein
MRQLGVQRPFTEPVHEFTMNADAPVGDLNHLLMLAIERALAPPIVHRRSTFQPMRVVVVDREMLLADGERDEIGREMPRLLPRATRRSRHPEWQLHQRPVRGEILSDESGRLFEKLGHQIRPLHQLASGPSGEVIDVMPAQQTNQRDVAVTQPHVVKSHPETADASVYRKAEGDAASSKFFPAQETTKEADTVSHRKLFADPGQWRILSWGEFKEVLSPQLAHPERLRDSYRLPCYVQVLETEREVAISELAGSYKSDVRQARLYFLTDEIAAKLDLVLPLRAAPPQNAPRPPNTLLPHERVFRLIVANDPTIDIANSKSKIQSPVSNTEATNTSPRCEIPGRFVKEWEFKITRDEALYDMNVKPGLTSSILNLCRRLRVGKNRKEFNKWQALLMGKNTDEQLWAVRPPKGQLTNSELRNWAFRTLELGGYDSSKMIVEWEIFWRRRAL